MPERTGIGEHFNISIPFFQSTPRRWGIGDRGRSREPRQAADGVDASKFIATRSRLGQHAGDADGKVHGARPARTRVPAAEHALRDVLDHHARKRQQLSQRAHRRRSRRRQD